MRSGRTGFARTCFSDWMSFIFACPLSARYERNIPLLATHFLRKYTKEIGRNIQGFSRDALKTLAPYHWPGNLRELENEVKRAIVLTAGREIQVQDLSESITEERLIVPETAESG